MPWRSWGLLVAVIALVPVTPARGSVPVVVIDGQGFGHGVGMAQDGAFWMAKAGATTPQILGQFYPGTNLGRMTGGAVRVAVFTGPGPTVAFPEGGRIDDLGEGAPGFPIRIDPGGRARVRVSGGRVVVDELTGNRVVAPGPATTTTTVAVTTTSPPRSSTLLPLATTTTTSVRTPAPAPAQNAPANAPSTTKGLRLSAADGGGVTVVDRQRTYRGVLDVTQAGGGVKLVNQVDVEQYLRGMGEVRDPSWPAAALRTQAVAARTYALRAMKAAGEICDGQRCQVYLGRQAEYPAMDKAVAGTAGQVLVFNKTLASAVYSSNGGGHSASREEGFGTTGGEYPYLRPAPYTTQNPLPWSVTIAATDVVARLGGGPITDVRVLEVGPSGRALTVALDGPGGRRTVSGLNFARALGLRSTMFSTRVAEADVAPDAPTGGSVIQAPPDEVALADDAAAPAADALRPVAVALPDSALGRNANTAAERKGSTAVLFVVLGVAVWLALAISRRRPSLRSD